MYSTSAWPPHRKRCSKLPCVRQPLWTRRIWVWVVLASVLFSTGLPVAEYRGRRRWDQQERAAELVAEHLLGDLHARSSAVADSGPPQGRGARG